MPTIISAGRWEIDKEKLGPTLKQNQGLESKISTQQLLESIKEIEKRPEMKELDRLLMASPLYLKGKGNV